MTDAQVLRKAAYVLRKRSRKPDGLWCRAVCRLLEETAVRSDEEDGVYG